MRGIQNGVVISDFDVRPSHFCGACWCGDCWCADVQAVVAAPPPLIVRCSPAAETEQVRGEGGHLRTLLSGRHIQRRPSIGGPYGAPHGCRAEALSEIVCLRIVGLQFDGEFSEWDRHSVTG